MQLRFLINQVITHATEEARMRGRIAASDATVRLELLGALPVATDYATAPRAWREILALARAEKLTAYDAAYLELAIRKNCALATRDNALIAAATRMSVQVLP